MKTSTGTQPESSADQKERPTKLDPAPASYVSSLVAMDTLITIELVNPPSEKTAAGAVGDAFRWFEEVEARCSRFDPDSELSRLSATVGEAIAVSPLLFRAVEFAVAVAVESGGAFDPTVGRAMARMGFDTNFRTGEHIHAEPAAERVSYRDIVLDADHLTVTLMRPLTLDLGAVAKGLATDLAAAALRPFENFAINAGGDLYLAGTNVQGEPWDVGIRHPRQPGELADSLRVSGVAVCSSGDYERRGDDSGNGHHILEPGSGKSAGAAISATVVAPTAMLADALATAAFVLGLDRGIAFLERHGVEGMLISPTMQRVETKGFGRYRG